AVIHLGLDDDGRHWQDLTEASLAFHEGLAHWLTRLWFLPHLDLPGRAVFSEVETRLPAVYRLGDLLPKPSAPQALESVRHQLLRRGAPAAVPDALAMAARVVRIAHQALEKSPVGGAANLPSSLPTMPAPGGHNTDFVAQLLHWVLKVL